MVLYIIRHGNPDYEHDTLTPLGEKEAEALGERMKKEAPDLIYMSPRGRAIATAKPTCQKTGLTGSIENWMTERNEYMYSPDAGFLSGGRTRIPDSGACRLIGRFLRAAWLPARGRTLPHDTAE